MQGKVILRRRKLLGDPHEVLREHALGAEAALEVPGHEAEGLCVRGGDGLADLAAGEEVLAELGADAAVGGFAVDVTGLFRVREERARFVALEVGDDDHAETGGAVVLKLGDFDGAGDE